MSRSTIANRRALQFDKELELRDIAKVAAAATASEPAIAFPATKQLAYKAVIDVAAHTGYVAGTAQWAISVEVSADNVTFKTVAAVIPVGTQTRFEVALSGEFVEDVLPSAAYVRTTATKTGAPGNLTYGAFLSRC